MFISAIRAVRPTLSVLQPSPPVLGGDERTGQDHHGATEPETTSGSITVLVRHFALTRRSHSLFAAHAQRPISRRDRREESDWPDRASRQSRAHDTGIR